MSEEDIRRIVREEIAAAAPVIVQAALERAREIRPGRLHGIVIGEKGPMLDARIAK